MSQELTDNPLGIWGLGHSDISRIYKHAAPLGLKNVGTLSSYTHSRPLECSDEMHRHTIDISLLWSERQKSLIFNDKLMNLQH